ncbi:MAG: SDR family NAD(P)-dependent oxidoreductase [Bdellovibrionales bacterium]
MTGQFTVLITGTTSGLGRGLLEHYYDRGDRVICVNRRSDAELESKFPKAVFKVLDISSRVAVTDLLQELDSKDVKPNLFFLNAGINRPDNTGKNLNFEVFDEVMRVNFDGTISFVAAAQTLGVRGATFVAISSMAILSPNIGHLSYFLSKYGVAKMFYFLRKSDLTNRYKTVVLGPVRTNITHLYGGPVGWKKKAFSLLAKTVNQAVPPITRFAESRRTVLYWPLGTAVATLFARALISIMAFFGFSSILASSNRKAEI